MAKKTRDDEQKPQRTKFNHFEEIIDSTQRAYCDLHTESIRRRSAIAEFELEQIEAELETIATRVQILKDRRKKVQAMIVGLRKVLESRC